MDSRPTEAQRTVRVPLAVIAREWTRIGLIGFGGPPAHIALLRRLTVEQHDWIDAEAFQDANAACSLLPGPASTQLAILTAYPLGGVPGAIIGGFGFIVPAVVIIIALSLLFLEHSPPLWVRGAGAGAGAAVAAVALAAARALAGPSLARVRAHRARLARWALSVAAGGVSAALIGPYLVIVLLACGAVEVAVARPPPSAPAASLAPAALASVIARGGFASLVWTGFKVGALAFGGGFVIIPLIQNDAVHTYHWMSNAQFLNAVALGQVTPGPVVATVAAVGYAAHGVLGGVLAALVAFTPSFALVLAGGRHFERLRTNGRARAFLDGAGPAAIGAIAGASVTLARALSDGWQFGLLAAAAVALLLVGRGVVGVLIGAGAVGVVVALAGGPLP